jgi:hypothetical protein
MATGILSQMLDKIQTTTSSLLIDDFHHQIVGRYNNKYEAGLYNGKCIFVSNSKLSELYKNAANAKSLRTEHKLAICLSHEFAHKLIIDVDCIDCKNKTCKREENMKENAEKCMKIIYKYVVQFFNENEKLKFLFILGNNGCGFHLIFYTINVDHILYQIFLYSLTEYLNIYKHYIAKYKIDQGIVAFSLPNGNGYVHVYPGNGANHNLSNSLPIIVNLKNNLNSMFMYGIDNFFACNDLDYQNYIQDENLYCLNTYFKYKEEDKNFFCSKYPKLYNSILDYYNYYTTNIMQAIKQYNFSFAWKNDKFNYWPKYKNPIQNFPIITATKTPPIMYKNANEVLTEIMPQNDYTNLIYDKAKYTNRLVNISNINQQPYFVDEPVCEPKFNRAVRYDLPKLVSYKLYKVHKISDNLWDKICESFYNEYFQIDYHRAMCNYLLYNTFNSEINVSITTFINSTLQLALDNGVITGVVWDLWTLINNNKTNVSLKRINEVVDDIGNDDISDSEDDDNSFKGITFRHLLAAILENAPSKHNSILLYYYHHTEKSILDELLDCFKTFNIIRFIYSLIASKFLNDNQDNNNKYQFSAVHFEIAIHPNWPSSGPMINIYNDNERKNYKEKDKIIKNLYLYLKAYYFYCFKYDEQKFFYNGIEYVDEKNLYNDICEHVKWEHFKICKVDQWKCLPAIPYIYPTNLKNGHFSMYFNLITHSFETASGGIPTLLVRNFEPNEYMTRFSYIDSAFFDIKELLSNGLNQLQRDINYSLLHVIIKHSLFPIKLENDENLKKLYLSNEKKYTMTISINDYRHLFQVLQNEDYNLIRKLLSVEKIGEILNWIIVVIAYVCSKNKINYKLVDYKSIFNSLFGDETNSIMGIPDNNIYCSAKEEQKRRKQQTCNDTNVRKKQKICDDHNDELENVKLPLYNQMSNETCSIYSFNDLCNIYSKNQPLNIISLPDCIQENLNNYSSDDNEDDDEETNIKHNNIIPTFYWTEELVNFKNFNFLNPKQLPKYLCEAFRIINNEHVNFLNFNIENAQFIPNDVLLTSFIVTIHVIKRLNWYSYKHLSPWKEENEPFPNIITSNIITKRSYLIQEFFNLIQCKWPYDFYIEDYSKRTQVFTQYFREAKFSQNPYLHESKKKFLEEKSIKYESFFKPIMEALSYLIYMSGFNNELLNFYLKIIHSIDWPGQWPKKMFLLFGESNAGKSKFAEILQLYGSRADTMNDIDTQTKNNKPETVIYYNNFLAIIEEITKLPNDFKRIISEASISYRKNLGNNFMRGFAVCKIFSTCNRIPPIDSDEEALFKRIFVCPINHRHQDPAVNNELEIRFMNVREQILYLNKQNLMTSSDNGYENRKKRELKTDIGSKALPFIGFNKFELIFPKTITHNRDIVLGLQLISFYFTYFAAFHSFTDPVNLSKVPVVCEEAHANWLAKFSAYHKWKDEYQVTANDNVHNTTTSNSIDHCVKGISIIEIDKSFTDFCARNGKIAEKDKLWTWFEREFDRYKTTDGNYDITIKSFA